MSPVDHFLVQHVYQSRALITRFVGKRETDDAIQEIATKLWKRLNAEIIPFPFNPVSQEIALAIWLSEKIRGFTSGRNTVSEATLAPMIIRFAKDYRSKCTQHRRSPAAESRPITEPTDACARSNPVERATFTEHSQMLYGDVKLLPVKQRCTVCLRLEGKSNEEIAAATGQLFNTVRSQLFAGTRALQHSFRRRAI